MSNKITCPQKFKCTRLPGQSENVCCPNRDDNVPAAAEEQVEIVDRPQSSKLMVNSLMNFLDVYESFLF